MKALLILLLLSVSLVHADEPEPTDPDGSTDKERIETVTETEPVSVIGFFEETLTFIKTGIYEYADNVLERVAAWYIIWNLEFRLFVLKMGVAVADLVIESFDISATIEDLLNDLDSRVLAFAVWLKLPEAINMVLSAYIVRFVMGLF